MRPPRPAFAIAASASDASDLLPLVRDRSGRARDVLSFCRSLRISATGRLLMMGDLVGFFQDLERSAGALAHFVSDPESADIPAGLAAPLFDAIASDDSISGATIREGTEQTWHPEAEYEDDFLYMRLMMDIFAGETMPRTDDPRFARYEEVLEGNPDPRLDICRALVENDPGAFEEALEAIVDRQYDRYELGLADDTLDPDEAVTTALVSIEGLALVRLAGMLDLEVRPDHPLVPSLARRVDLKRPLGPNGWQEIEVVGVVA